MATRRSERKQEDDGEIRCPNCNYFVVEIIESMLRYEDDRIIQKIVCRSCRVKLLLKISPEEVVIGQI